MIFEAQNLKGAAKEPQKGEGVSIQALTSIPSDLINQILPALTDSQLRPSLISFLALKH